MFKRTRSLSNAICNTHKIFLSECSWMTKKFRVTWSHNSTCISSHIEDNGCQHIGVTTSTCQGHVTFPVTWPFDSPGAISYRCSIVTESLSPAIFEIMGIFYIWVPTLTFLSHVTSPVTWPIDPPYVISYWCPIVTEPLSLTVFEIFGPQNMCAHTDHTETRTETRRKWFYILSHAMYCIGQTKISSSNEDSKLVHAASISLGVIVTYVKPGLSCLMDSLTELVGGDAFRRH